MEPPNLAELFFLIWRNFIVGTSQVSYNKDMTKIVNYDFYKKRVVDEKIETYLNTVGAICIEGPKWCGNTRTSSFHAKK